LIHFYKRERKTNLLKMADEFDIDDLLEAPYQKVKNEETEDEMLVVSNTLPSVLCKTDLKRYRKFTVH